MKELFWVSLILIIYIYVGYPLLIGLLSKQKKNICTLQKNLPSVSILIAAYNEEEDIAATITNKIDLDYPRDKLEVIVVSDESTDDTDAIVKLIAESADIPVKLVRQIPRQGKTSGLNMIVPMASGEVIVFSDANSIYDRKALRILVENFSDDSVGYVTGKMVYMNPDGSMVGDGCSAYMKYENWMREKEVLVGSVVGVDGGIDAMRKTLYDPLKHDQLPDFVQPLKVVEKGYRVVYEPGAVLKEDALSGSENEYVMRVRVTLRAMWALKDMSVLFNPFKYGMFSLQLFSHKLLRYLAFIPLIGLLILNILLINESGIYLIFLILQILFYSLACLGMVFQHKKSNPAFITLPYYFALLNFACVHAAWRFIKGEKQAIWKPRTG